ncbi:acyl-CoA dehydrogenase family protein [candidate division KSB1 bacterium]
MLKNIIPDKIKNNIKSDTIAADREGIFPEETYKLLKNTGVFEAALEIDRKNIGHITGIAEEISIICAGAASLFVINTSGLFPLLSFWNKPEKKSLLDDFIRGDKLMGYALSGMDFIDHDPGEGVKYIVDGDNIVLSGKLDALLMGERASGFVVLAGNCTDDNKSEKTAFFITREVHGIDFGINKELLGLRAVPVCSVEFNDCVVSGENIVGEKDCGEDVAGHTESFARILASAQCLGLIRSAYEHANEFGKERKQFGKYIGEFQSLQDMMTDMQLSLFSGSSMLSNIAGSFFMEKDNTQQKCAQLKLYCSGAAMAAATNSVQIFGGFGFMRDYPVEKLMRDAKVLEVFYGNTHHLKRILAKYL